MENSNELISIANAAPFILQGLDVITLHNLMKF